MGYHRSEGPPRVPNREQSITLVPTDSILSVCKTPGSPKKQTPSPNNLVLWKCAVTPSISSPLKCGVRSLNTLDSKHSNSEDPLCDPSSSPGLWLYGIALSFAQKETAIPICRPLQTLYLFGNMKHYTLPLLLRLVCDEENDVAS